MDAFMRRLAAFSLITLLALPATPALAGTDWLCSLSDDAVRLLCVADQDPRDDVVPPAPTAQVRGTAFPLDARRLYTVDLWSVPSDPDWVELLARSTICYRSPGCSVTLTGPLWDTLQLSPTRSRTRSPSPPTRQAQWAPTS
jgi:hypothetical protein